MPKGFVNILVKELREMVRDPKILLGMIVVPVILFPILGAVMSFSVQSAQERALKASILVLNNDDNTYFASDFVAFLADHTSLQVVVYNDTTPQQAVNENLPAQHNTTFFVEIPQGFNATMTEHLSNSSMQAVLNEYSVFSFAGAFESLGTTILDSLIAEYNRNLAPDFLATQKSTVIKGVIKEVDPTILSGIVLSQAIALPITTMILLTYSMQIAATSVAMEKEEKTLETLLTMPVSRFSILMGKLSGSIVVAAIGAVAYMLGFTYYLGSFTGAIQAGNVDLSALGLVPTPLGYVLLGASLFVTLLSALALAVIMSAFVEDVRGAQSLVGYIYPLIFIPSFLLIYVDVNALPLWLRIVVYAIPYSQPILASKSITLGDYQTAALGIIYVTAFTLIIMYVASRLFATEKILTAKLRFGRRRGAPPSD